MNTKKAGTVFCHISTSSSNTERYLVTVHSFFEQIFLQGLPYARRGLSFGTKVNKKTDKTPAFWNR